MTATFRLNPTGFRVPALEEISDDFKSMFKKHYHCIPEMEDTDKVASLLLSSSCLEETGGGGEILQRLIFKMQDEEKDMYSQRLPGAASWWAQLLLRLGTEPYDLGIFSLEDLGFTDPKIFERATVADLVERGRQLGLRHVPYPSVAALVLAKPKVSWGSGVVIMTEPVNVICGDLGWRNRPPYLKYWLIEGRSTESVLHYAYGNPTRKITEMEDEKMVFGSCATGEIDIPSPAKLGFMFVVPPGFRLPQPRPQQVIEVIESPSITLLADTQMTEEVQIFALPSCNDDSELISTASTMQEAVLV